MSLLPLFILLAFVEVQSIEVANKRYLMRRESKSEPSSLWRSTPKHDRGHEKSSGCLAYIPTYSQSLLQGTIANEEHFHVAEVGAHGTYGGKKDLTDSQSMEPPLQKAIGIRMEKLKILTAARSSINSLDASAVRKHINGEHLHSSKLSRVLGAVQALEKLASEFEILARAISTVDGKKLRQDFRKILGRVHVTPQGQSQYTKVKDKVEAALGELVPRQTWLESQSSAFSTDATTQASDVQWIRGNQDAKESCTSACKRKQLNCDASRMYIKSTEQLQRAAVAAGSNCTSFFEQPLWGKKWDGPWILGDQCGYVSHDYWIADCNAGCNFARLCPCSNHSGEIEGRLPKTEPKIKTIGPFEDVDVTLPLDETLMQRGAGVGNENRSTVGHNMLKDLGSRCLVYSFGSAYESGYEKHMASFGCQVHIFDCTLTAEPDRLLTFLDELAQYDNIVFHPWCVGKAPHDPYNTVYGEALHKFYTLDQMMGSLNHTSVDIVKFDIEGFEWSLFDSLLNSTILPDQVAFELHTAGAHGAAVPPYLVKYKGQYEVDALFHKLFSHGYQIASKEGNAADEMCCEFVIVKV